MPTLFHDLAEPAAAPKPKRSTYRKATLDSLRLDKQAEGFRGLPVGVKHPLHLLEILKRAAPELKISRSVVTLIDQLFRHTNPRDWTEGSRPIVWPSNATLALSLGIRESALCIAIQAASCLGLVVMKDSPTRARRGQRDARGAVIPSVSFGFDLSPLAIRYAELAAAAKRRETFIKAHSAARRSITITRYKVAQIIETAVERKLWGSEWAEAQQRLDALQIPRRFAELGLAELEHFGARLAAIEADARGLLDLALATQSPDQVAKVPESDNSTSYEVETGSRLPENREPMKEVRNDPNTKIEATAGGGDPVSGLDAALQMVEVFESVGAAAFDLTHTDIDQQKKGFRPAQTLEQIRASLPHLVPSAAKRQNNIIIRPRVQNAPPVASHLTLIQLDDLEPINLEEIEHLAFMTLQTSSAGRQAWIAVNDAPKGLASRLRAGLLADQSASGAVRMAGTQNFKRAYEPCFPIVRILTATPGLVVSVADIEALGVLPPEKKAGIPPAVASRLRYSGTSKWPDYGRCIDAAPTGPSGRPQRTKADFVWSKIALSWGHSVEATAAMLMRVSSKAQENGQSYATKTAEHAAFAASAQDGPAASSVAQRGRFEYRG